MLLCQLLSPASSGLTAVQGMCLKAVRAVPALCCDNHCRLCTRMRRAGLALLCKSLGLQPLSHRAQTAPEGHAAHSCARVGDRGACAVKALVERALAKQWQGFCTQQTLFDYLCPAHTHAFAIRDVSAPHVSQIQVQTVYKHLF
jgi:hypothetical protein